MITTYGDIARAVGVPHDARRVAWVIANPRTEQNLPFHRVVNWEGRLTGAHAFGDNDEMRRLLIAEGITFLDDGRVDMDRHRWPVDQVWPPPTK
jgi:alkylated DNA nucleotide flippase Atl1